MICVIRPLTPTFTSYPLTKATALCAQFVSPLYGKAVQQFIPELVNVQDLLGQHQDSIIAVEHLRQLG